MRSVYLCRKPASKIEFELPSVNLEELRLSLAEFKALNADSPNEAIFRILAFLSYDHVLTADPFLYFLSSFQVMPYHTLPLLKEDFTYVFLARILFLVNDAWDFLPHLYQIDLDAVTSGQEQFILEMFTVEEIMHQYIYRFDIMALWNRYLYALAAFLSKCVLSSLNLRFGEKVHEVDQLFALIEAKQHFYREDILFLTLLSSTFDYTDRILNIIGRVSPEQYQLFLEIIIQLYEKNTLAGKTELIFNVALYAIYDQPGSALTIMRNLIYMGTDFYLFAGNLQVISALSQSAEMRVIENLFYFLSSFCEFFYSSHPCQLQELSEDCQLMQKIIGVVTSKDLTVDAACVSCTLIRQLVQISAAQMDAFVEVRFDVLDSLSKNRMLWYFEDYCSLESEFGA